MFSPSKSYTFSDFAEAQKHGFLTLSEARKYIRLVPGLQLRDVSTGGWENDHLAVFHLDDVRGDNPLQYSVKIFLTDVKNRAGTKGGSMRVFNIRQLYSCKPRISARIRAREEKLLNYTA